jgi:hypothetical protein
MAVQEVRWDNGGIEPADDYIFFYGNENEIHHLGTGFFFHNEIRSAIKRIVLIRDRMSYVILRVCWCVFIFLNVHAPTEDKSNDTKDTSTRK